VGGDAVVTGETGDMVGGLEALCRAGHAVPVRSRAAASSAIARFQVPCGLVTQPLWIGTANAWHGRMGKPLT
jgi:hypothetical protein